MKIGTKRKMEETIMKKSLFLGLVAVVGLVGCSRNQEIDIQENGLSLIAKTEGSTDSRTVVEDQVHVYWEPGDEIMVYNGEKSAKFVSELTASSATATFKGTFGEKTWLEDIELWAVYPYSEDAVFDGETITTVLPSEQIARAGSFGKDMNLAVANSFGTTLQFYNVGGGVRFSVTEEGIKKVMFEGLHGEIISGKVKIGFEEGLPEVQEIVSGSQFITLLPPEGSETFEKDTWYYIVAIPGSLDSGFKVYLYTEGSSGCYLHNNSVTIKRKIFGSVTEIDKAVEFVSYEIVDESMQAIADLLAPCVTDDYIAPELLSSHAAEIASYDGVESVDIGDAAMSVLLSNGETLIYPYDYPSVFDDSESITDSSPRPVSHYEYAMTRASSSLDQGYFDADVYIFNLFSDESGRKNQNQLLENAKYTLENGLYKKTVCYLGLKNFTVENVKKAVDRGAIIFFSTLGSDDGKTICSGEKYVVDNAWLNFNYGSYETYFVTTEKYEDKYKSTKRFALNVEQLLKSYKGPLMYFASCNSLKGDFGGSAHAVGWDGVNKCGQAYALIIADYIANGRSMAAFLKDFTDNHTQVGTIVDPLEEKTKLKWLNGGWYGSQDIGFYENLLKQTMTIVTPIPGSIKKKSKNYTVKLEYRNPDPANIVTNGKNCSYEKGNMYYLGFDDMSGMTTRTGSYLYADKNSKVSYSDKPFGVGVWRIALYQQAPSWGQGYTVGQTYLIMHSSFKANDGETEDEMPNPDVKTLSATIDTDGALCVGAVINRTYDGLETGFQYYKLTEEEQNMMLSANDSLRLVGQGTKVPASYTYQGYFGVMITDIDTGGKYLVRAYAADESNTTSFGDILSFKYGEGPHQEYVVPEIVDLGLSVKWASFNIGATWPEEKGVYFAWGETAPKDKYGWDVYKWANGTPLDLTKYCTNPDFGFNGFTDGKTVLELEDDAAYVSYGSFWRMPTIEEWYEIRDNCTVEWSSMNGVMGCIVTGPNGNRIFFPSAGYDSLITGGYYWSSTGVDYGAFLFSFDSRSMEWHGYDRDRGCSIRPVYAGYFETTPVESVSLSKTELKLSVGEVFTLVANVKPSNATYKNVLWNSDNEWVAKVSPDGVVTGVGSGSAVITATTADGWKTAICRIIIEGSTPPLPIPEVVDLGLSVKWASCNLGASKPEEYGDYYAWGEIKPHYYPGNAQSQDPSWISGKETGYDWDSYKWCWGDISYLTKYCNDIKYGVNGFIDNKSILDPGDDAAFMNLGGKWRMPTKAEQDELRNDCSWEWTSINGINGQKVTGPNGNSIFLPAAGYRDGTNLNNVGSDGQYWSSILSEDKTSNAYYLYVYPQNVYWNDYDRCCGFSIRPVYDDK